MIASCQESFGRFRELDESARPCWVKELMSWWLSDDEKWGFKFLIWLALARVGMTIVICHDANRKLFPVLETEPDRINESKKLLSLVKPVQSGPYSRNLASLCAMIANTKPRDKIEESESRPWIPYYIKHTPSIHGCIGLLFNSMFALLPGCQ